MAISLKCRASTPFTTSVPTPSFRTADVSTNYDHGGAVGPWLLAILLEVRATADERCDRVMVSTDMMAKFKPMGWTAPAPGSVREEYALQDPDTMANYSVYADARLPPETIHFRSAQQVATISATERTTVRKTALANIGGGRAVVASGIDGVMPASAATAAHATWFLGVTIGAVSSGWQTDVVVAGEMEDTSWSFTTGQPVFISSTTPGVLTQTVPATPGSAFALRVGVALSPTVLFVRPTVPVYLV